jgi:hypothetical protein
MNPHLSAALAAERQRDFEHAAGCCTPGAELRRRCKSGLLKRLAMKRRAPCPAVCCA